VHAPQQMERPLLEQSFGTVVRELRTAAGLSQERLAERADLHRNYVGLIERGLNSPTLAAVSALAGALGLLPSELVRLTEERAGLLPTRPVPP